jgi:hypothetical protein
MKVQFLKNHLKNKAGDVVELEPGRANYFHAVGVAGKVKEVKPVDVKHVAKPVAKKSAKKKK